MPEGPTGKPPINRTPGDGSTSATNAARKETFQPPAAVAPQAESETPPTAKLAAQLVQSGRTAQASGNPSPVAGSLGELVNAITSQMGVPDLLSEQKENLIARLAEDPVVKGLIGLVLICFYS